MEKPRGSFTSPLLDYRIFEPSSNWNPLCLFFPPTLLQGICAGSSKFILCSALLTIPSHFWSLWKQDGYKLRPWTILYVSDLFSQYMNAAFSILTTLILCYLEKFHWNRHSSSNFNNCNFLMKVIGLHSSLSILEITQKLKFLISVVFLL